MTAKADTWPVDLDRKFWRICGIFEKSERGRVVICKKDRVRNDIVYNATPVARRRSEVMTSDCDLELPLRVKGVLGR
jgi:hypothetical protein